MNLGNFGMDAITLAGSLETKLRASRSAGFTQMMLWASDLVGYPGGLDAAVRLVRDSGIRASGIQVMRDYEGLTGTLHEYKIDVAKSMLQVCRAVGAPMLLVSSTTSSHASSDFGLIADDLSKLATLAVPMGIRIGYEAVSWGKHINDYLAAWEVVDMADHSNLDVVLDSFNMLANDTQLDALEDIPASKIGLVQFSDFMWRELRSPEERIETAQHLRVFPGEGAHSMELSDLVRRLHRTGYRGDYSFEVFNDDYLQMPPEVVAQRARASAKWVTDQALRRGLPVRESCAAPL